MGVHHERPDGRGYPRGLEGDDVPLEARISSVADSYEAMTHDRSTGRRSAWERPGGDEQGAGQFDEQVVEAFQRVLKAEGGPAARACRSSPGPEQRVGDVVADDDREQGGVEAVQHSPVLAEEAARVLDLEIALDHRLEQVTERARPPRRRSTRVARRAPTARSW